MNSLLNLQGRRAKSAEGISIFKDVQRRLNALGIVHSALYKGDDFRVVDLCALLTDLCRSTESQLSAEWGTPMLTMRCDSPANALPDSALTLAFLVTELISTATSDTAPEGQHATQLDFDLSERPEGGMALTLNVDQPVLHSILEHPDDGRINLFRGLVRQLRGHIDLAEDNRMVTIRLPSLI